MVKGLFLRNTDPLITDGRCMAKAGATQNNILWNMQECILISFEGSIRFSLVTAKTRLADGKHQSHCQDDMSLQLA